MGYPILETWREAEPPAGGGASSRGAPSPLKFLGNKNQMGYLNTRNVAGGGASAKRRDKSPFWLPLLLLPCAAIGAHSRITEIQTVILKNQANPFKDSFFRRTFGQAFSRTFGRTLVGLSVGLQSDFSRTSVGLQSTFPSVLFVLGFFICLILTVTLTFGFAFSFFSDFSERGRTLVFVSWYLT